MGMLKTEWIRVATEGTTIDGRTITKEWIDQMAETYNTEEYVGLIWPEHRRFNWFEGKEEDNWGEVVAVKSEMQNGKQRLFVQLRPNSHLLLANEKQQKLFTSIEFDPDFCSTGKCYLVGLAVTDRPASTGTTRLQFSANKSHEVTALYPLEMEFQYTEQQQQKFIKRLFSSLFGSEKEKPTKDEAPMNEEQFAALTGSIEALTLGQAALQETLTQHFAQQSPAQTPTPEPMPEPTPQPEAATVSPEQFNQLVDSINAMAQGTKDLQTQFSQLLQEAPNQRPDFSGGDFDTNSLV
ncbi:GPO family capsid scaffolding protein [Photobacterium leiognathi subsp. mandapamensis]|uniref:GPO family capsid scaffolding protein n=2 Tax=Photobacterium leiognathi TaxID=553611 RepID=UPI003AF39E93